MIKILQSQAVLGYAAGLMDGEGCIQISKPYSKKNGKRYHRLDICIAQKDPRPLQWMIIHFGGRIQKNNRKAGYIGLWIVNGKNAEDFLRLIRPYLVLKGEQADLAFAYRATVSKVIGNKRMVGGWGKTAFTHHSPIDADLESQRDSLRDQLSKLKEVKVVH